MKRNRRNFTSKFKFQVAMDAMAGKKPIAEIARDYDVHPNLVSKWKQDLLNNGYTLFEKPSADNKPDKKIEQLEKIIGKQTVELELAKNFLRHYSCR